MAVLLVVSQKTIIGVSLTFLSDLPILDPARDAVNVNCEWLPTDLNFFQIHDAEPSHGRGCAEGVTCSPLAVRAGLCD